jgi:hypothetical protein
MDMTRARIASVRRDTERYDAKYPSHQRSRVKGRARRFVASPYIFK